MNSGSKKMNRCFITYHAERHTNPISIATPTAAQWEKNVLKEKLIQLGYRAKGLQEKQTHRRSDQASQDMASHLELVTRKAKNKQKKTPSRE